MKVADVAPHYKILRMRDTKPNTNSALYFAFMIDGTFLFSLTTSISIRLLNNFLTAQEAVCPGCIFSLIVTANKEAVKLVFFYVI